jgi:hypothetical protein
MNLRGTCCENVRGIELGVHSVRLTRVDHKKDLVIAYGGYLTPCATNSQTCSPFFLPHLFKSIRDVKCTNLFVVLEFEKFVASVTSHVHENV